MEDLKHPGQIFHLDVRALTWRNTAKCSFRISPSKKMMPSTWLRLLNCIYDHLGDAVLPFYYLWYISVGSSVCDKTNQFLAKENMLCIPYLPFVHTSVKKRWRRTIRKNIFFVFCFYFWCKLVSCTIQTEEIMVKMLYFCAVLCLHCLSLLVSFHVNSYFLKQVRCGILPCDWYI